MHCAVQTSWRTAFWASTSPCGRRRHARSTTYSRSRGHSSDGEAEAHTHLMHPCPPSIPCWDHPAAPPAGWPHARRRHGSQPSHPMATQPQVARHLTAYTACLQAQSQTRRPSFRPASPVTCPTTPLTSSHLLSSHDSTSPPPGPASPSTPTSTSVLWSTACWAPAASPATTSTLSTTRRRCQSTT